MNCILTALHIIISSTMYTVNNNNNKNNKEESLYLLSHQAVPISYMYMQFVTTLPASDISDVNKPQPSARGTHEFQNLYCLTCTMYSQQQNVLFLSQQSSITLHFLKLPKIFKINEQQGNTVLSVFVLPENRFKQ